MVPTRVRVRRPQMACRVAAASKGDRRGSHHWHGCVGQPGSGRSSPRSATTGTASVGLQHRRSETTTDRRGRLPAEFAETLRWLDNNTPTLDEFARPAILRPVLDSLALRLDGSPASASTVGPQEVRRLQRPGLRGRTGVARNQPHGPHPQSARTAHRRCRPACRCQPPAGRESLTGRPNDPPVNRGVLRVPVLRRPAAGRGATSSREQPLVARDRLGLCAP